MMKWISIAGGVVSVLTIFAMTSAYPDFWIYTQTRAIEQLEIKNSAAVESVTSQFNEHMESEVTAARAIAQELQNTRLLVEEGQQALSRKIDISSLEAEISQITQGISQEQSEIDRLDRIISGHSAAGPSDETYRARDRAEQNLLALNLRLDLKVREVNRIMQ